LLLDLLKQQNWKFEKKRTNVGFVVEGVNINRDYFDNWLKSAKNPNNILTLPNNDSDIDRSSNNNSLKNISNSDFENW
jgi:hypothetical protein